MSHCPSPLPAESAVLQLKLKALILDVIHNISVVKELHQAGVTGADAWAWKKQLRFYMRADKCCVVHMVDAQFSYTYEYQVCLSTKWRIIDGFSQSVKHSGNISSKGFSF